MPSRPTLRTGLCLPLDAAACPNQASNCSTWASCRTGPSACDTAAVTWRNFWTPQPTPWSCLSRRSTWDWVMPAVASRRAAWPARAGEAPWARPRGRGGGHRGGPRPLGGGAVAGAPRAGVAGRGPGVRGGLAVGGGVAPAVAAGVLGQVGDVVGLEVVVGPLGRLAAEFAEEALELA